LQRELEKAMLENLQEQNAKLMRKLSKLEAKLDAERSENSQASKHDNTQSTANQQPEPKTPPHNTPMMTPLSPSAAIRYTPGGTRVPSGPPPEDRPQIPEWPESLKFYEVKEEERTTFRDCRQWEPGLGLQRTGRGRWGNKDMGSGSGGMGGSSSRKAMGSNHTSRHTTYRPTSSEERDSKNITNHQQAAAEETEHSGMKRSLEREEGTDEEDEQVWAERRKYWQKPVSKGPRGASASGREASKVLTAAAKEMRARMYTQEEVDQMLQQHEASKKSEQSKPTTYERGDEGLRSFPITLPQLPEPSIANASLEAGDWLTQVRPLISDVSGNASAWWAAVEEETAKQYHLWLTAAPLDKLKVAAPDNTKLAKGNERLAQRVAVMLMQAVPQGLRQELVASRQMEATHILFRVYKAYQPGGLAERRHTLSQLTSTSTAKTPQEAVAALRLWKRQAQRAVELQVAMPDAVLQVRALTTIMEDMLAKDPQASFRVSSHRMTHGIDVAPSTGDINLFYDLLLAEAEHMVMSNSTTTQDISGQSKPHVKALQASTYSKGREPTCKYWGHEAGCRAGRACKYQHDWYSLPDKSERCWVWSSKGHRKSECPTTKYEEQPQSATGGSAPQESKGTAQEGNKGKAKGKDRKGGKGKMNPASTPKQEGKGGSENKSSEATEQEENQPSIKAAGKSNQGKEDVTEGTRSQEELVSEVTSLLRSLRVDREEPRIRVMQVKSIEQTNAHTLIDGGATHCLRQSRNQEEWKNAQEVKVKLAAGEMKMRQCQETGTLLVEEPVQAIIPVAKLTENGYVVKWDRESCRIEHVRQGKIPIEMNQGCPTVQEVWGKRLMEEVEETERRKARIRAIMACGVMAEDEHEKKVAELQALFPQVPMRILERIPGEKQWDPDQLPFNRRKRRQIQRAKAVVINMCSGPNTQRWRDLEKEGVVVLNLDVLLGVNVMDPHVAGWLESIIESGKVVAYTSGPPCRSVSLCRHRALEDGGPKPVRMREGPQRFGIQGITAGMQEMADHDAALWLKNLWYMRRVKQRNEEAEVMLEQPQDPQEWCSKAKECPTFLNWPETRRTIKDLGLMGVKFCQGGVGHATAKPTTLATDMPELLELNGIKSNSRSNTWPESLGQRLQMSRSLAEWAPGLVEIIKRAVRRLTRDPPMMNESPYGKRTRSHERVAGSCGDEPHAIQKRLWSLRRDDGKRSAKKKTEEARAIHAGTRHSRTVCAGPRPGPIPQAQIHTHWGHDNPNVERTANG
jgi:hypothetical protein